MKTLLLVIFLFVVAVTGIWFYNRHNSTTLGEHVGTAIDAAPSVVGKTAEDIADSHALAKIEAKTDEALKDVDRQKAQHAASSAQ